MQVTVDVLVNATREKAWRIFMEIDSVVNTISGTEEIEVLERLPNSFAGLNSKHILNC